MRVTDDEGADAAIQEANGLSRLFPDIELGWVLEPEDRPIPWNIDPFYLRPGNPTHWSLKVPIMANLLNVAVPGQMRPCPMCHTQYTSNGERGQCSACGFIATPFRTRTEAKTISPVPLDAFGWGRCPRCRQSREFSHHVEQCFRCGQLLEGAPGRQGKILPAPNKAEVIELIASLDNI